jgi:hypothetical protein
MIYFEKRKYSREEMANIFQLDAKDKNFKAKLVRRMANLGFEEDDYIYTRKDVTILWIPQEPQEKITYLVRLLGIDSQVNPHEFAIFLYCLMHFEEYNMAPWQERADLLNMNYDINVTERTLRKWTNKLMEYGEIVKDTSNFEVWCSTTIVDANGDKKICRDAVSGDEQLEAGYEEYKEMRTDLLKKYPFKDAQRILWSKFHCCYYRCYSFVFNAWRSGDIIDELFAVIEDYMEQV